MREAPPANRDQAASIYTAVILMNGCLPNYTPYNIMPNIARRKKLDPGGKVSVDNYCVSMEQHIR